MNFSVQLDNYRQLINQGLEDFFKSAKPKLGERLNANEKAALGYLEEFSLRRAKRLRGALTIFTYEQLAARPNPSIVNAGLALELIQSYLLIIDDVMDQSDLRRGKSSLHKLISDDNKAGDEHLTEMLAVNIALLAAHFAQLTLLEVDEEPDRLNQASKFLHQNVALTAYGQIDDLYNHIKSSPKEAEVIKMYEKKSGYYSFVGPMQVGAALAGQYSIKSAAELSSIGIPAGVGFQVQDDILGLFGDEQTTGKSAADDLREGKLTLLIYYALQLASKKDQMVIKKLLGNKSVSSLDVERLRSIVQKSGALDGARRKAETSIGESKKAILSSTIFSDEAKLFLCNLLDFVIKRNS